MSGILLKTREEQLEHLRNFTKTVEKEIVDVASTLNWTINSIHNDDENLLVCPYDMSHRVSKEFFDLHLDCCQWKAEGYKDSDIPLSEPGVSSGTGSSIKLDVELQNNILWHAKEENPQMKTGLGERIIPRTSDRLLTDFTSDERRALYDYVVSHTVKPEIGCDITDIHRSSSHAKDEKEDRELSFLELLVQERNLKRRRIKHRGIHTNKKSHIEILREVINQQMELYVSCIADTADISRVSEIKCNGQNEDSNVHSRKIEKDSCDLFQGSSSGHRNSSSNGTNKHRSHNHEKDRHSMQRYAGRSKSKKKREHSPKEKRHRRHEYRQKRHSQERINSKEDTYRSKSGCHKKYECRPRESSDDSRARPMSERRKYR